MFQQIFPTAPAQHAGQNAGQSGETGRATQSGLIARLAVTPQDCAASFALRSLIFVVEMGAGSGSGCARAETDHFDSHAQHLILEDPSRAPGDRVVGVSRIIGEAEAAAAGGYYTAGEFDLAPLHAGGHRLLELGRTCLHPDYRGGAAMVVMWQALGRIVAARGATLLIGTASFPGADPGRHAAALAHLHRHHLAPAALRVRSLQGPVPVPPEAIIDSRLAAMRAVPPLIKSYLRLGGVIGDGVFVDRAFNTTDICLLLDVAALNPGPAQLYAASRG